MHAPAPVSQVVVLPKGTQHSKSIFLQCKIGITLQRKEGTKILLSLSLGTWSAVTPLEPEKPWIQKSPLLWKGKSSAGYACRTNPLLSDACNLGNKTAITRSRRVSLYLNQAASTEKALNFLPRKAQKWSPLGLYVSTPFFRAAPLFQRQQCRAMMGISLRG